MIARREPGRYVVVSALGIAQILAWGTSFYFPAVFAEPIVTDTGWALGWVVGGISAGLLVAGLISPRVGDIIAKVGGRPVLASSSILFAAGLAGIGLSPSLPLYLLAWVVVGLAMGTGLYDAAFPALGRLYGQEARGPIATLTLFGGFASAVCWPLSDYLIQNYGWRGACMIYAALHLVVALPMQLVMPSRVTTDGAVKPSADQKDSAATVLPEEFPVFALIALVLTLAAGIGAIVVVHLLIFLQARGVEASAAVWIGTLFGPAQVGARVVERLFGHQYHPIWTMVASCVLMAAGLFLIGSGISIMALAVIVYAAGYGISWIARGTLPLALFGAERYPRLMGRLAFPSLIVQALAPSAGAFLIAWKGADVAIAVLLVFAMLNVVLIGALWAVCRRKQLIK